MLKLWDSTVSGNAYKVRLLLALLGRPYERVEVSVIDRSDRKERFADRNPALRIPILRLDDGRFLAESNAILFYLSEGTEYLPEDRYERAQVLQWMFFEQYDHEPNVAVARFLLHFAGDPERHAELIAQKQKLGRNALAAMERRLEMRPFLVGDRYTVADIALFAYTHVADEAGIDPADFPAIEAWLGRVAEQPGHVALQD